MNPDQKHKNASWKYTALSSSDVSSETTASSTCESSPLLQNMENEEFASIRAGSDSTSQEGLVKIHKKDKHGNGTHSEGITREDSIDIGKAKLNNIERASGTENDRKALSLANGSAEQNGARPKTNKDATNDITHGDNTDKAPVKKLDIVRKMTEVSLHGGIGWQKVGQYGALKLKRCQRLYAISGRADDLALFHLNGKFFTMEAWCTHMGGPLFEGDIENYKGKCHVMCPWHSYMFDLETGKNEIGLQQKVYDMKYENGYVFVWYHSELSTEPIRKPSTKTEPKQEVVPRKTSVLESPFKL